MKNRNRYDWKAIQSDYDSGMSQLQVCEKYGCTRPAILKAIRRGEFISRTSAEGVRLWAKSVDYAGKAKTEAGERQRRAHLSIIAKNNNYGGYIRGSGRGKKGWYKGIWCDSSWELAYVIYCLDHNTPIKRNTDRLEYVYNGKMLRYIPDFVVDSKLIEIKGFVTEQSVEKARQHPYVIVVGKEEMKDVLAYVVQTYGRKFTTLYE